MKKLISAIKRRRFNKLCKKYPVLRLNDEILAIEEKVHRLYNTAPENFFALLNILEIRHFYVSNMRIINIWIDKEDYVYKVTLKEPECWNNGTP